MLLLIVATLVAVVGIIFFIAAFWLRSSHGLQWVQSRINSEIPGEIRIESLQLSLLHPKLDFTGVVLKDPQGIELAGFSHFSLGLDWRGLWQREIRLNNLLLQDLWADLVLDKETGINLMTVVMHPTSEKTKEAPRTDSAGLPFNIVFDSIRLVNGRFTFSQTGDKVHLEATGLNISAEGNLKNRTGNLDLSFNSFQFSNGDIHPEPASIVLKAQLNGEKLSVSNLNVTSGGTALNFSGSADHLYTEPVIDTILAVDTDLLELAGIFNLAGEYSGPAHANLTLKGGVANPDARLGLAIDKAMIGGQPLDRGNLAVVLKDRQVTIEKTALRLADGAVTLDGTVDLRETFPTGFLAPQKDVNDIVYVLNLEHQVPDINSWMRHFVEINGATSGQISLRGEGVLPSDISAQLIMKGKAKKLVAPGMDRPVDADVNLSARIDSGTISLSSLNVVTDGVELSGDGHFQMEGQSVAAELFLMAGDLSQALAVVGVPSVSGTCTAALSVDGSLRQPKFSADLASKNLKYDSYSLGDLSVKASMNHDGLLKLTALNLQNKGSRLEGNGHLRLLPNGGGIDPEFVNSLTLTLEKFSAADFMQSPPVNGTIDGYLQVAGVLGSLTGDLSLNGKALGNDVATIGDIDSKMRLNGGTIFVDRFHLGNKGSTFDATGNITLLNPDTLHLVQDPLLDFTAKSEHLNPGDFVDSASGNFTFNAAVKGSLENPVGRITGEGKEAKLSGQSLVKTLLVDARFEDRRIWLDQFLAIFAPGEELEGGGSVGMDNTMDLFLKSSGISVANIEQLRDVFPGKGLLKIDATAKGKMDNPDVGGHLILSDIIVNEGAMEDVNLSFSIQDMQVKITGKLNFDVDATYDLKKGDFKGQLIFDKTETASYFLAAGKPEFHGTLSGQVQAAGNMHDAANASVQVNLDALHLLVKDISLVQFDQISLEMDEQKLTIPQFEMVVLSSGSLKVKGDAHLGGPLDIGVDGQIPLAVAGLFSDELVDATGMITLKGGITGDTGSPKIDARIDLENIGMTVPGLVQKLDDLHGSIFVTPENIRIENMKGLLDTGSFSINGTIGHDKFTPRQVDLAIAAKALPLEVPDTLSMLLNADINITGKDRIGDATGEVVLLDGVYYKDVKINLLQVATDRKRTLAPASSPVALPYFDMFNLDIKVKNRQPFYVQNNLADLEISPDLEIGGGLDRPVISGRAEVKTGTVTFQKRTFTVKKGVIDFVNSYRTEAVIDIESEATIRNWLIKLAIKGAPDNLDMKLSSVPKESDSDILSLILFGKTSQELVAGEGGSKRSNAQIMSEMLADTFGEDIKKNAGVDILQLESIDGGDDDDKAGTQVTVGKHLSDRMTVKYAVESKDGTVIQRAITEYKLLEKILVSGFQDNQGIFGAELMFRLEFR